MKNNLAPDFTTDNEIYKDVVIVGNGPSAMALSFLLSGNLPYYTGGEHPDEMLTARLRVTSLDVTLLDQDLEFLSQGLEGRSQNPVAVLMDSLARPGADVGLEIDPLVQYRRAPTGRQLPSYIALGRGPPGGVWQRVDGQVLALSPASWMSLPGVPLEGSGRPPAGRVAQYLAAYPSITGISDNFHSGVDVTRISPPPVAESSDKLWRVEATDGRAVFNYKCRTVVLATGAHDVPNQLGVPGEDSLQWVFHDAASLERALDCPGMIGTGVNPVLIVGAGLSAADAVIAARFRSLPVLHVFRRRLDAPLFDHVLPENVYPEYHKVRQMMADGGHCYPRYQALADAAVLEFSEEGTGSQAVRSVLIRGADGKRERVQVCAAAILTGARPDLSFIPEELVAQLTCNSTKPVDPRRNPIAVDPYTHKVLHAPSGLYALGPLVGDTFVRFAAAGAHAVAASLLGDLT
ncbi:oxidative stress-induced growth inhibitor 1-like [Schistocerca nitens]|uniref:oxidative stress-induced growth inhibitor 1-like n=1 Tax=Schistocerca nitens TaxID=7011 RepID=UPI00211789C7|nr:oxidative stress-induced growth inhibitor 1-like [Schistocerca nitens]XP_049789376.1 oxidative stress-induced growth inhibitor 1-like [Schistocerca nitens]XP_049789377.1 oxidative stress-induced growth inhibitor 1-like [Schistocerca nitens]